MHLPVHLLAVERCLHPADDGQGHPKRNRGQVGNELLKGQRATCMAAGVA
jgi:hypothetical protein